MNATPLFPILNEERVAKLKWLSLSVQGHYLRFWPRWLGSLIVFAVFTVSFKVGINATESLPEKIYLISKWEKSVVKGQYVSFKWHGGGPYGKGWEFVKIVRGVPGDVVRFEGRKVYINDEYVAEAKPFSKHGQPLDLGPQGIIPEGKFFVFTPHPDSLDSRYAMAGWIDEKAVVGRAYGLY